MEVKELEKQKLSTDIMRESFHSLPDIIASASQQQLKELYSRIIEGIEWQEDPTDQTLGHCKISYFEQPNLQLPKPAQQGKTRKKTPSQPNKKDGLAECLEWLPREDSNLGLSGYT